MSNLENVTVKLGFDVLDKIKEASAKLKATATVDADSDELPLYTLKPNELPVYDDNKRLIGGFPGQSMTGFKVAGFKVKTVKGLERVILTLEANVEDIGAGTMDIGGVLNSFTNHMTTGIETGVKIMPPTTK